MKETAKATQEAEGSQAEVAASPQQGQQLGGTRAPALRGAEPLVLLGWMGLGQGRGLRSWRASPVLLCLQPGLPHHSLLAGNVHH